MNVLNKLDFKYNFKNYSNSGNTIFLLGIFFLPTALPIGGFFLLISIIISFCNFKENFLKQRWNLIFFIILISFLISTIYSTFINPSESLLNFQKSIIWLNLFNWIPIYFAFIGFQIYLKSERQRSLFQKFFIAGTIPVLISCIMQKFFNIYGPFETLFGTIVWFNYYFSSDQVSGLFNNPNYLGMWLTLCLPFAISELQLQKNNSLNSIILYLINFLTIYFAFATFSRNALLGIIIALLFILDRKKLILFCILFFTSFLVIVFVLPSFSNILQLSFLDLSEANPIQKFASLELNMNNPRIAIWSNAIDFISMRPFLGWGSGSFPHIFYENANLEIPLTKYQHTHNLIIEIAYNFGIPIALFTTSSILCLFLNAQKKINALTKSLSNSHLYKPFIASLSIFLMAHLTDITYYDGKISILFSLLLAGLKNITDENIELKDNY